MVLDGASPADEPLDATRVRRQKASAPPSMIDVARVAGVSQKTVSRVVNSQPHVRAAVRERVEAAIEALGYRPNSSARALVTSRTWTIGMVTVGSSLLGPVSHVHAVEAETRLAGYSLALVRTPEGDPRRVGEAVEDLLARNVEAIVISEPAEMTLPLRSTSLGVPVLVLDDRDPEGEDWIAVSSDVASGARQVTEHLLSLGHDRVWHVAGPDGWRTSSHRREGWCSALVAAGRDVPPVLVGDWSAASGYEAGRALAVREDMTAVFVANDEMAIGLIHAVEEAGLSVPDDVSVAGLDDADVSAYLHTPLTTVRQDFAGVAREGIARLLAAIDGHPIDTKQVSVPVELVVRDSTAAPAATRRDQAAPAPTVGG